MPELIFTDRSFNKDHTTNYHLSIQADRNGLSYCIGSGKQKEFIVFKKYKFEHVYLDSDLVRQVISVLDRDEILRCPFQTVRFMGYTQQFTLVPSSFFNPANLADYLQFSTGGTMEGELFSNHLHPFDAFIVFGLSKSLVSLITLHFKKVEFSSQAFSFLWNSSNQTSLTEGQKIHLGLNTDFFDVAITEKGKLLLYNTFQYVGETDLLYYVLYVCKQLSIKPDQVPVVLSGELSSRLVYSETLKQYLPGTRHDEAKDIPLPASGLTQSVTSKFLNIFNLQACASSVESIKAG